MRYFIKDSVRFNLEPLLTPELYLEFHQPEYPLHDSVNFIRRSDAEKGATKLKMYELSPTTFSEYLSFIIISKNAFVPLISISHLSILSSILI